MLLAGDFTAAGNIRANNIAALDPASGDWSSLGDGLNAAVTAVLSLPNGEVIAGGSFTVPGGSSAGVARWNGSAWEAMGGGLPPIEALALLPDGTIAAGGATGVWTWDGAQWTSRGTIGNVRALASAADGSLVAGGSFTTAGAAPVQRVARWDGQAWLPMGQGLAAPVHDLELSPAGSLVAAGEFGGGVAAWNGAAWDHIGFGVSGGSPTYVFSISFAPSGDLVCGGNFEFAGPTLSRRNIARWNGAAWLPFGGGLSSPVRAVVAWSDDAVFADPTDALTAKSQGLRRWSPDSWALAAPGSIGTARAVAVSAEGDLLVGGSMMTHAGGVPVANVALRTNGVWNSLAGGLSAGGEVYACAFLPNGNPVIGGSFTSVGGIAANNIAQWNGSAWQPLGSGATVSNEFSVRVLALLVLPNGDLIAGGDFRFMGGVQARCIARWDGSQWHPLAAGQSRHVRALALLPDGSIAAGGGDYAALWDGAAWMPLPVFGGVVSLTTLDGDLIAGGGSAAYGNIARWTGDSWQSLSGGVNGAVSGMTTLPNGDLIVCGAFGVAGGSVTAHSVARWSPAGGGAWHPMGSGTNGAAYALTTDNLGRAFLGGSFTLVSEQASPMVAQWTTPRCCSTADFDNDGDTGTDADIEAFFACLAGACCPTCWALGADFDGDGDTGTDADIDAFFRVLAGDPC